MTNPLTKSDVVNNLTTTTTNVPLSAAQGKILNDNMIKVNVVYNAYTMSANVERVITPSDAGCSINSSRIIMALPFLVTASSGNTTNNIMVGVNGNNNINFKLKSAISQELYVKTVYLYK